jgi:hypothetical protein
MIIKHKLHKIALVSIAMVLMLVSTAGAFPFCGCGYGCGNHSCDHSNNDKSSDESSNKCIVCPGCPTCPACNCPTCPAPALDINKTGNITGYYYPGYGTFLKGYQNNGITKSKDLVGQVELANPIITYNYTLTNIGNVGLSRIVIYDNKTSPNGMSVNTVTTLAPGAKVTVNTTTM